ncbi:hypothetical protein [Yinghuangia sp. YIM S10712]|uniref:hypothetical protein n=1 Tax=Yinghuangia sp. YIM S10712 TaxID=3436930 RepID=UPI003F536FB3
MRQHTTCSLRVRVAATAAAVAGTCAALTAPASAAPGPVSEPVSVPAAYAAAAPAPEAAGPAGQDPDSAPAQGGHVSEDGGSGDIAPAMTVLTFLGLGAIAVAVTADKRRKSGY